MKVPLLEGDVTVTTEYQLEHRLPSGRWTFGRWLGSDPATAEPELAAARAMNPDVNYRVVEIRKEVMPWS